MHCYPSLAVSISLFPIQPVMMMLMIFNVYKGDDGVYEGVVMPMMMYAAHVESS